MVIITNDTYTNEENTKSISLGKPAMEQLTKVIIDLEESTKTNYSQQSFQRSWIGAKESR
jgi:hypothetical protein